MTSSVGARSAAVHVRRAAVAIFVVLFMLGLTVAHAPKSQAWTSGACKTSNGVTVIVDFAGLGGGLTIRCAPGSQSTGISALRNAGFSVGFVQQNSSQGLFVCRINNKPGPSSETCADTPPASASWSYWHANRGGSWRYSSAGAGNRQPQTGGVEGWRFTNGRPVAPAVAVPAVIPAKPSKPTAQATTKPTPKPNGASANKPTQSAASGTSNTATGASSERTKDSTDKSSAKSSTTATATGTPTSSASDQSADGHSTDSEGNAEVQAASTPEPGGEPSSPAGTLGALAVVALLGGGAAYAWSRRSRES